jgi:hypothetical protein
MKSCTVSIIELLTEAHSDVSFKHSDSKHKYICDSSGSKTEAITENNSTKGENTTFHKFYHVTTHFAKESLYVCSLFDKAFSVTKTTQRKAKEKVAFSLPPPP